MWRIWILNVAIAITFSTAAFGQQQFYDTVSVNGVTRQYLVYLPANFEPEENLPVMLHFHGGGGSPEAAIQFEVDYRPLADADRFIAIYPAALLDNKGCTCWNNEGPYSNGIDELGFAAAMIDAIASDYNADEDRIYASGFSLGGSLIWDLTCYLGDRFAAVAVVAANMWEWTYSDCSSVPPTGMCHILGTNDFYAPYNGNQYSISVALQNAHWVSINNSEVTPIETPLGGGVTQYLWSEGDNCHTVMHYRRQGGGHDWPSFARQAIWDFVSTYDTNGLIDCNTSSCIGDINNDGLAGVDDLLIILDAYETSDNGDLDEDGDTDVNDILILIAAWGPCQ